jgi:hypothetical protein
MSSFETRQIGGNGGSAGTVEESVKIEDVGSVMQILHYNQNLVQLADSKAGNFIVINSIFMASITSFMMAGHGGGGYMEQLGQMCQFSFFIASVAAIFLCLRLIMTKGDFSEKIRYMDLIFFGDITHRKNSDAFIYEFTRAKPKHILKDILRRIYATSIIADRKFALCRMAQNSTLVSSVLWLATILVLFLK